jgi:hypothetical protein
MHLNIFLFILDGVHDPELLFLFQVMPYSTGCKTPLSNFEAAMDYRVSYFGFLPDLALFFCCLY